MKRLNLDITDNMQERISKAIEKGWKINTSELVRSGIDRELVKAGV